MIHRSHEFDYNIFTVGGENHPPMVKMLESNSHAVMFCCAEPRHRDASNIVRWGALGHRSRAASLDGLQHRFGDLAQFMFVHVWAKKCFIVDDLDHFRTCKNLLKACKQPVPVSLANSL